MPQKIFFNDITNGSTHLNDACEIRIARIKCPRSPKKFISSLVFNEKKKS